VKVKKNTSLLESLITVFGENNKDCNLINVSDNTRSLTEAILNSKLLPREDISTNDIEENDPELAEAMRLSLEEEKRKNCCSIYKNRRKKG